jgi:hypothetical protein
LQHLAETVSGCFRIRISSSRVRRSRGGKKGAAGGKLGKAEENSGSADSADEDELSDADSGSAAAAGSGAALKEEIAKVIRVRAAGGEMRQRSVAQLSGGEKKRVALALGLGYAELAAARARLSSNVLVLDEVRSTNETTVAVPHVLPNRPPASCTVTRIVLTIRLCIDLSLMVAGGREGGCVALPLAFLTNKPIHLSSHCRHTPCCCCCGRRCLRSSMRRAAHVWRRC